MSTATAWATDEYYDLDDDDDDEDEDEYESDQISLEPIDPKDDLVEKLRVDFGTTLRKALTSPATSGYAPKVLNELNTALFGYQESQFDSVLSASGFTKRNEKEGIIDWKGSCQTGIRRDTDNGGLICAATHTMSVIERRTPDKWINLAEVSIECRAALDPAGSAKSKDSVCKWKVTEHSNVERPRRPSNRSVDTIKAESRR